MRIPLTDEQGRELPIGTRISFVDTDGVLWVGHKDGLNNYYQFNPLPELGEEPWAIGDWDLYSVMSD